MNKRCGAEGVKTLVVFKMSSIELVVRYRINFTFQRQRLVSTIENITIVRIDLVDDCCGADNQRSKILYILISNKNFVLSSPVV